MTTHVDLSLPVGYGLSPSQLVDLSAYAEDVGLHGVCCGELAGTEAMSLLGAIAVSTDRIVLETSVVAVLSRSPALHAMAAATLDDLTGGRFSLGLGAGSPRVASFHGAPFERPLDTVGRWVRDIRAALDGASLETWGGFRLRGITSRPLKILVSAMNDRMVALASSCADGVVLNFAAEAEIARLAKVAAEARVDACSEVPFEVHAVLWAYAGDDVEHARQRFRLEMAPYLAVSTYRRAAVAIAGEDAVGRAAAAFASGGRIAAAAEFPDRIVDALLTVGGAEAIAARVRALGDAGCTGVRFTPIADDPGDLDENARTVQLLGDVVAALDQRPTVP